MVEEFAPQAGRSPKDIQINITGPAPGEKLDEDLIASNEWDRTYLIDDELAMIAPEHRKDDIKLPKLNSQKGFITRPDNTLSKNELRAYLKQEGII